MEVDPYQSMGVPELLMDGRSNGFLPHVGRGGNTTTANMQASLAKIYVMKKVSANDFRAGKFYTSIHIIARLSWLTTSAAHGQHHAESQIRRLLSSCTCDCGSEGRAHDESGHWNGVRDARLGLRPHAALAVSLACLLGLGDRYVPATVVWTATNLAAGSTDEIYFSYF
eukprot:6209608-Pleurochrysis_carterae.AAC.5